MTLSVQSGVSNIDRKSTPYCNSTYMRNSSQHQGSDLAVRASTERTKAALLAVEESLRAIGHRFGVHKDGTPAQVLPF
jgi:hypothetical protein